MRHGAPFSWPSRALGVATLAVAGVVAACMQGGPASNGLVEVVNQSQVAGSFGWQSPGVVGGSGSEPIPACEIYRRGFAPGHQEITVTSGSESQAFTLEAPSTGQATLVIVIEADGSIVEVQSEAVAPSACASAS